MAPITSRLLARCAIRGEDATTTRICATLGAAIDSGLITLPALLDLVRSCATADQLADALVMLAATVPDADTLPQVCYPPAPAGRFRVVGECEQELEIPTKRGGA